MTAILRKTVNVSKALNLLSKFPRTAPVCGRFISSGLDLKFKDDIGIVTMKNKDNRLNDVFLKDFNILLDSVEENKTCKGFMSIGEGKFYSNGIDLEWLTNVSAEELIKFSHDLNALLLRIVMFPVPTMAAVNGHAFAGGAMIASAHDIRIMNADKGWLCLNEVYLGIKFSEVMLSFIRIKFGGGKNVADALVLGRRFTAADALACNIIHDAKPGLTLEEDSIKVLQSYLGKTGIPRGGVSLMKNHVYESVQQAFDDEVADKYETFSKGLMNETQKNNFKRSK